MTGLNVYERWPLALTIFRWTFSVLVFFFLSSVLVLFIFTLRSVLTNVTTYERMKNKFLNKITESDSDLASVQSEDPEYEKLQ